MSTMNGTTCIEIADAVRSGRCSALAIVEETLERIARDDAELNSFRETFDDDARARAREIDEL